jgi:hypothetical protein
LIRIDENHIKKVYFDEPSSLFERPIQISENVSFTLGRYVYHFKAAFQKRAKTFLSKIFHMPEKNNSNPKLMQLKQKFSLSTLQLTITLNYL